MSDIKKKLILEASLDDQKLKKQIQDLKKSIESVSVKQKINQQTSSSVRSARTQDNSEKQKNAEINKAYKQREAEIKKQAQMAKALHRQEIAEAKKAAEVKKQLAKEVAAFEAQTQKDKVSGKEKAVSSFKKVQAQQQKADERRQKEELAHAKKIEDLKDKAQQRRIREAERAGPSGSFKEFANPQAALKERLMAKHGHKLGSDESEGIDIPFAKQLGAFGRMAGPLGFAAGAGIAAGQTMQNIRQIRSLRAQRQQGQALRELQGEGAEGAIELSGREDTLTRLAGGAQGAATGGLAGAAGGALTGAALGSIIPVVGTAVGAAVGATIGGLGFGTMGAFSGAEEAGQEEGQTRLEETALGRAGLGRAREQRRAMRGLLRGGGVSEDQILDRQQYSASAFGLSTEETMQDIATARESLGNQTSVGMISMLQGMREQTGTSIGEQAAAAETLGGFSGQGSAAGVSQIQKVFKDAVSTGLDASKSGKFLQATAQYIESTAGFANVDTRQISGRMADLTSGFAGPGGPTLVDIQKAQQAQMMLQQESFGESGLAGVGNVTGVMNALGPNATGDQFLAALGASSNATVEDLVGLGLSEDQAKAVQGMKQEDSLARGTELLGLDSGSGTGAYLAARERGTTTESQLALDRAVRTGEATGPGELPGVARDSEAFKSLAQEAKRGADAVKEGFDTLKTETDGLSKRFEEFSNQLREQSVETRRLLRQIQRSQ